MVRQTTYSCTLNAEAALIVVRVMEAPPRTILHSCGVIPVPYDFDVVLHRRRTTFEKCPVRNTSPALFLPPYREEH